MSRRKTRRLWLSRKKCSACGGVISAAADSEELKAVLKIPSDNAKKNELYLKYHRPLERIADEAELKYLYLFMYGGSKVWYISVGTP